MRHDLTWKEFLNQVPCAYCPETLEFDVSFAAYRHVKSGALGCEPRFAGRRPLIVTLCGSTRFKDEFMATQRHLTLLGIIVISVGLFGHVEGLNLGTDEKPTPIKRDLDALHLRKIDQADAIVVINKDDYVGTSTRREIAYAVQTGKPVFFIEKHAVDSEMVDQEVPV